MTDSETQRYWHAHDVREAEWRSGFMAGFLASCIGIGLAAVTLWLV